MKNPDKSNWQAQVLVSGSAACLGGSWDLGAGCPSGTGARCSSVTCQPFPSCDVQYGASACAVGKTGLKKTPNVSVRAQRL